MKFNLIVLTGCLLMIFSCQQSNPGVRKPYKFPISYFDSLVRGKHVIYDQELREDGSIKQRKYYLADSAKYVFEYNKQNELMTVTKFNGSGSEVWQENYFPNGQRMSHYEKFTNPETGVSEFQGDYEAFYETGYLKEKGSYQHDMQQWIVPFDPEGNSGDTIVYQYKK